MAENEAFLFGGRLIAFVLGRIDEARSRCKVCSATTSAPPCTECLDVARAPLKAFCRGLWWEIAAVPSVSFGPVVGALSGDGGMESAVVAFRESLRASAAASLELLREALSGAAQNLSWLDEAEWGGLLGVTRQNNINFSSR